MKTSEVELVTLSNDIDARHGATFPKAGLLNNRLGSGVIVRRVCLIGQERTFTSAASIPDSQRSQRLAVQNRLPWVRVGDRRMRILEIEDVVVRMIVFGRCKHSDVVVGDGTRGTSRPARRSYASWLPDNGAGLGG